MECGPECLADTVFHLSGRVIYKGGRAGKPEQTVSGGPTGRPASEKASKGEDG